MIELDKVYKDTNKESLDFLVFTFQQREDKYCRKFLNGNTSAIIEPKWYLECIENGRFVNTGFTLAEYKLIEAL